MGSIVETIILISIAFVTGWYVNTKIEPQKIHVSLNGEIESYIYDGYNGYSCPIYCGVDHIHFANDSLYNLRLEQYKDKIIKKK